MKKTILQILEGVLLFMSSIGFLLISSSFLGKPSIDLSEDIPIIAIFGSISLLSMPISALIMLFSKKKWKKFVGILFSFGTIGLLILFGRAYV